MNCGISTECSFCKNLYTNVQTLSSHYYKEHQANYHCEWCYQQFNAEQEVKRHAEKSHVGRALFHCIWCNFTAKNKKLLVNHRQDKHGVQLQENSCPQCSTLCATKDVLKVHRENNHGETNKTMDVNQTSNYLRCQYCPCKFDDRVQHCLHTFQSHQEAYVLCSYCEKHFESVNDSRLHLQKVHHDGKSWTCIYCWEVFEQRPLLKAHQTLAQHSIINCPKCTTLMPSDECLTVHRELEIKRENSLSTTFLNSPKKSNSESKHENSSSTIPNSPKKSDSESYLCLACFQRIPSVNFFVHSNEHIDKRDVLLSCNECFLLVTRPENLDAHQLCFKTEAERQSEFLCHVCGYKSETKKQWNRHFGWCHNKKSKCRYCSTKSVGYVGQIMHNVRHHGEKLWETKPGESNAVKFRQEDASDDPNFRRHSKSTNASDDDVSKRSGRKPSTNVNANVISLSENRINKKQIMMDIKQEPLTDVSKEVDVRVILPKRKRSKSICLSEVEGNSSEGELHAKRSKKDLLPSALVVEQRQTSIAAECEIIADPPTKMNAPTRSSIPDVIANIIKRTHENVPSTPGLFSTENPTPISKAKCAKNQGYEFVCTLCGNFSDYKASLKRHVQLVHRIPFDVVGEFCQEREKLPPPIVVQKAASNNATSNQTKNTSCQTNLACLDCDRKDKQVRKLKNLLKRFMTAATQVDSLLDSDPNDND